MKIAMIPLNSRVGDVVGNLAQMLGFIDEAQTQGCALVVFPELALVGYPPKDWLFYDALLKSQEMAFATLRRRSKKIMILTGAIGKHRGSGCPFTNSAVLFHNARRQDYAKQLLPNYDVFDEARYFEPGTKPFIIKVGRLRIGVTVCEDIWSVDAKTAKRYHHDPLKAYAALKPDLLLNLSASPYAFGKRALRRKVFARAAKLCQATLLHVNQLGANDDLIFDGGAMAFSKRGECLGDSGDFQGTLCLFDTDTEKLTPNHPPLNDLTALQRALEIGIADYVHKTGHRQVVLGLSGGIDSAVVACLAVAALGPKNVLGVLLPSRYTQADSNTDALLLAKALGMQTQTISINDLHKTFEGIFENQFGKTGTLDLTAQNVQARIRSTLLMAIANNTGRLLLNTTNKSEMAVGYGTLYGDLCGALAVLSDVPKTLVYELANQINSHFALIPKRTIVKAPSAELKPDQQDSDSLPTYDTLDPMLNELIDNEQLGLSKDNQTVLNMVFNSEYKRRQAPPGLKVSAKAFGLGRRVPIAGRLSLEKIK
jgi:NAD+ synthetase